VPNHSRYIALVDARFVNLIGAAHVPLCMRGPFTQFAKRVLHVKTMNWCGMCGMVEPHDLAPFWLLGTSLCPECCSANFASRQRLLDMYGLSLDTLICGKMLMEHMLGKVFIAWLPAPSRDDIWRFSTHVADTQGFVASTNTFFVWLPDLAKLLDLPRLAAWQRMRKETVNKVLVPWIKSAVVKRAVIAAQREGVKRNFPSKLFTMNLRQKTNFLGLFRRHFVETFVVKRKPRRRNMAENVFGPSTRQLIGWLETNQRGSLLSAI
jgi:hypothetical protein